MIYLYFNREEVRSKGKQCLLALRESLEDGHNWSISYEDGESAWAENQQLFLFCKSCWCVRQKDLKHKFPAQEFKIHKKWGSADYELPLWITCVFDLDVNTPIEIVEDYILQQG